jgi:hypothetical protein
MKSDPAAMHCVSGIIPVLPSAAEFAMKIDSDNKVTAAGLYRFSSRGAMTFRLWEA